MPILRIEKLVKHFGGVKAIEAVSFNVNKDETVGLIGPNGAGKTTLFNLVSGSLKANSGEIVFKDSPITNLEPHRIARLGISRTFQNIRLFRQLTVAENVFVGGIHQFSSGQLAGILNTPQAKKDADDLWEKVNRTLEFIGIVKVADEMADSLSYGIQRRVEIARGMVSDPEILMLDEPTAGMNPVETLEIVKLIEKLQERETTVMVIEHDMKVIMNACKHIVVLNYGEVIAEGTPDEVRNIQEVIEAYLGSDDQT